MHNHQLIASIASSKIIRNTSLSSTTGKATIKDTINKIQIQETKTVDQEKPKESVMPEITPKAETKPSAPDPTPSKNPKPISETKPSSPKPTAETKPNTNTTPEVKPEQPPKPTPPEKPSLQMIERPLMTIDELKSIPKGTFVVMKTGTNPIMTKLKLFSKWGITFDEVYSMPENANRKINYVTKSEIISSMTGEATLYPMEDGEFVMQSLKTN